MLSSNPDINIFLGQKVKEIRKNKKMTRETLAEKIDVSSRFLADVECGKVGISLTTLKKLCKTLGISSDSLLGLRFENQDMYNEIEEKIHQISPEHLENLNTIITAFSNTAEK